jgi:hypothetical protein
MRSRLETQIPLESFHRHFISMHMKGAATGVLSQLEREANQSGKPISKILEDWMMAHYPQSGFRDDACYAREVPLDNCYFAHTDVHCLFSVPKDHLFVEFMRDKRNEIDAGTFPLSAEIRAPWQKMPEPLIQERRDERYYVLDGQLRVLRHWYHAVPNVKVFIYRGKLAV